MDIPSLTAIITAGGKSERFSPTGVKKEFLKLEDGHTVLFHATAPFLTIPSLTSIIVTCPEGSEDETVVALEELANINGIPFLIIPGGESRTESVKKALEAYSNLPFKSDFISVHDGARPFIDTEKIISVLAAASVMGAAAPALKITDAIKEIDEGGKITGSLSRAKIIRVQTPQIFNAENLLKAYSSIENGSFDDDIAVYSKAGFPSYVVKGWEDNRKITFLSDIPDADSQIDEYIKNREEGRSSYKAVKRMRELMNQEEEGENRLW